MEISFKEVKTILSIGGFALLVGICSYGGYKYNENRKIKINDIEDLDYQYIYIINNNNTNLFQQKNEDCVILATSENIDFENSNKFRNEKKIIGLSYEQLNKNYEQIKKRLCYITSPINCDKLLMDILSQNYKIIQIFKENEDSFKITKYHKGTDKPNEDNYEIKSDNCFNILCEIIIFSENKVITCSNDQSSNNYIYFFKYDSNMKQIFNNSNLKDNKFYFTKTNEPITLHNYKIEIKYESSKMIDFKDLNNKYDNLKKRMLYKTDDNLYDTYIKLQELLNENNFVEVGDSKLYIYNFNLETKNVTENAESTKITFKSFLHLIKDLESDDIINNIAKIKPMTNITEDFNDKFIYMTNNKLLCTKIFGNYEDNSFYIFKSDTSINFKDPKLEIQLSEDKSQFELKDFEQKFEVIYGKYTMKELEESEKLNICKHLQLLIKSCHNIIEFEKSNTYSYKENTVFDPNINEQKLSNTCKITNENYEFIQNFFF